MLYLAVNLDPSFYLCCHTRRSRSPVIPVYSVRDLFVMMYT